MSISLGEIEKAAQRLQAVVIRTPLLNSAALDERLDARVFIKPECLQHIGAFKFRGAYNRLCQLSEQERALGVVAFSSGNHAQGVAYAAKLLGMSATIVMPSDAPKIKLENTKHLGATVRLYDRDTESRVQIAAEISTGSGATLVPAFDDEDIINGQGTCGLEIMQQLQQSEVPVDAILVPVGGGGLLAGTSTAIKALSPNCKVVAVEPENYDDHLQSKLAGHRVKIDPQTSTACDALMATIPGEMTWAVNSKTVDDFLVVTEDEVKHAISFAFRYLKLVVEPGGVVPLAALLSNKIDITGQTVSIILSGGNIDAESYAHCLKKYPAP